VEELATFVAYLFAFLIAIAVVNLVVGILVRKQRLKLWIGHVVNTLTGLVAIFGISIAWSLGAPALLSVLAVSIVLTFPRRTK
jgi:hypothetical protein